MYKREKKECAESHANCIWLILIDIKNHLSCND